METEENIDSGEERKVIGLTPPEIVDDLDRFIIGQKDAKKAVAVAHRNRARRMQVPEKLRDEIVPKNILMVGPTGTGKTEISRRLAKIDDSPFIKVEATKFTEVGYVGKEVDSIIRDLVNNAVMKLKNKKIDEAKPEAEKKAADAIVKSLVGEEADEATKDKALLRLEKGKLEEEMVTITVNNTVNLYHGMGQEEGQKDLMEHHKERRRNENLQKERKLKVKDARPILVRQFSNEDIDLDTLAEQAVAMTQQNGIVFLDEIDKICVDTEHVKGFSVSREGVQRDLLPLLEGTTVSTKYGQVKTDHILFIASGAFHVASVKDLLPELQGRLPIRVKLEPLTEKDFVAILTETEANLPLQYRAMMETEGVDLEFTEDSIKKIAEIAVKINNEIENIGARRLMTIMEKVLDDISFEASGKSGEKFVVDADYVVEKMKDMNYDEEDSFIL